MEHQKPSPTTTTTKQPSTTTTTPATPATASSTKTKELDYPIHAIGFEIEEVSATKVSGRFIVTYKCCQPFKVLHGGVSAMIAEALASIGAHWAGGLKRVAGIHLTIDHIRRADLGDLVLAEAVPINVGRTIQVWEVRLWKANPEDTKIRSLISTARVSLLCNLPVPDDKKDAGDALRKYAKL